MGPNGRPMVILRGKHKTALRAVREHVGGLRLQAYPSAMADLEAMGVVEKRAARWRGARSDERAWFLTEMGKRTERAHGGPMDE